MPLIPAFERQRQEDFSEFEASLTYILELQDSQSYTREIPVS